MGWFVRPRFGPESIGLFVHELLWFPPVNNTAFIVSENPAKKFPEVFGCVSRVSTSNAVIAETTPVALLVVPCAATISGTCIPAW